MILKSYLWHTTHYMWHGTHDTWHVTWKEVNILSTFQVPSSYGFGVNVFWRFGGKGSLSYLVNDKAICKTAPATPGMLNTLQWEMWIFCQLQIKIKSWTKIHPKCCGICTTGHCRFPNYCACKHLEENIKKDGYNLIEKVGQLEKHLDETLTNND